MVEPLRKAVSLLYDLHSLGPRRKAKVFREALFICPFNRPAFIYLASSMRWPGQIGKMEIHKNQPMPIMLGVAGRSHAQAEGNRDMVF